MTLRKAMRVLVDGEAWTVATENGEGWLFYFDGKELHNGTRYDIPLDEFTGRECLDIWERHERKHWSEDDRKWHPYMELEAGLAFIVTGNENGNI